MLQGNLAAALQFFLERDIEFIVAGGIAAVLQGAPIQTYDIDLVYSLESANVDRLLGAVEAMDAIFRVQPERRLRPDRSHLAAGGHLNLLTRFGPLDLLGTIGRNLGFAELYPHSREVDVAAGMSVRVLNLETIISIKEQLASEKDLAALPILRRTLQESKKTQ